LALYPFTCNCLTFRYSVSGRDTSWFEHDDEENTVRLRERLLRGFLGDLKVVVCSLASSRCEEVVRSMGNARAMLFLTFFMWCGVGWSPYFVDLVVVERQLDLMSVAARLRASPMWFVQVRPRMTPTLTRKGMTKSEARSALESLCYLRVVVSHFPFIAM
ncbi:hypothetical protein Taro_034211, partial [Colocasia esculenta]|nr:hypothetical protein [Colocasia esculenta]